MGVGDGRCHGCHQCVCEGGGGLRGKALLVGSCGCWGKRGRSGVEGGETWGRGTWGSFGWGGNEPGKMGLGTLERGSGLGGEEGKSRVESTNIGVLSCSSPLKLQFPAAVSCRWDQCLLASVCVWGGGGAVRVNGCSFVSVIPFYLFQLLRVIGSPFPHQHQPPKDKQVLDFEVNVNTSVFQLCWK